MKRFVRCYTSNLKTSLFDFHVANGAKMVPFAGWMMPMQYDGMGAIASHLHCRTKSSLFDVSHMLQTEWFGKDAIKFIETLTVGDIHGLEASHSTLSLFTTPKGGILDDTVIHRHQNGQSLYVVSNAGTAEKMLPHIMGQLSIFQSQGGDVQVNVLKDESLVALQGPKSVHVLKDLGLKIDFSTFAFMSGRNAYISNVPVFISRCGYTGEDGFEIRVNHKDAVNLCTALCNHEAVELAGLGARDSLRLEAGLCLYGHDLNEDINPVEAGLVWTIGKRRRTEGGFYGSEHILPKIKGGVSQKRIGLIVEGAPAREGAEIFDQDGQKVGIVTSGCPSPVLKNNIAMGYIKQELSKAGSSCFVKVRGRNQKATVTKMPFVPHKYYRNA